MKLRDSPLCQACPYNATESLQHFLLEYPAYQNIRDQSIQKIVDHMNAAMLYFWISQSCRPYKNYNV